MSGGPVNDACSPRRPEERGGGVDFTAGNAGMAGQRLDYSLRLLLPHLGLRGRKRRIESGLVLVNGRPSSAAYRLRPDDVVALARADSIAPAGDGADVALTDGTAQVPEVARSAPGGESPTATGDAARLLGVQGAYCFFYKPAGMHSVSLAGGTGHSLEALLPDLLRGGCGNAANPQNPTSPADQEKTPWPTLLQRLDCGTSGIVCAAFDPEAEQTFRKNESVGRCEKRYVALLVGQLQAAATVKNALRTDKRSKSLVVESGADKTRWTDFLPLCEMDAADISACPASGRASGQTFDPFPNMSGEAACVPAREGRLTLVGCRIRRGARHQIRAHAAFLGHPLWGDVLYGGQCGQIMRETEAPAPGVFYLHHGALLLPWARCVAPPPWPFLSAGAMRRVMEWLDGGTPLPQPGGTPA